MFCSLQVIQATNQIVMNCADIDIITASFAPEGGEGEGENISTFLNWHNFYVHIMTIKLGQSLESS